MGHKKPNEREFKDLFRVHPAILVGHPMFSVIFKFR